MRYREHSLQSVCVRWFRMQYPKMASMLIAVPNAARRNAVQARILKDEGMLAGVADLLLLVSCGGYGCLCIEMKTAKGRQSDTQKEWQAQAEANGDLYVVCRDFFDFKQLIDNYLNNKLIKPETT